MAQSAKPAWPWREDVSSSAVVLRIPNPTPILTLHLILISSSKRAIQTAISQLQDSATAFSTQILNCILLLLAILWKLLQEKHLD